MTKEANFKEVAKMIVKQVAGRERLVCFVNHVDNDIVVTTSHYMLVVPKEVFKRDFKTEPKLGRYENFFFELGNSDYYIRNNYGKVEVTQVETHQEDSVLKTYNEYFVEEIDAEADRFIPAFLTTVNINTADKTFTVFKRQKKSLLCIDKDYIDMLQDTPLSSAYGYSIVTLNDDKRYNPICYRTPYGEVDNKLRYYGFLVLPCSVDADSVLKHVLGME